MSSAAAADSAATGTPSKNKREEERTDADVFGDYDIFGGDSELSDIDDEGSVAASPQAAGQEDHEEDDFEAPGEEDDDEGDEYRQPSKKRDLSSIKIPRKKRDRAPGETGNEGATESRKRKKKSKKRPLEDDEREEDVDPEIARRRALDARLDALVKKPKNRIGSGKKRRGQDEEDLDMMNDEAVARLRQRMLVAADEDLEANENQTYAVSKLRLLPEVVATMQKSSLAESVLENGLLEAVKRWLEPLPDRSLPAVNIQRELFSILRNLPIETSTLKSSGIGKVVYFYTKCKRVEPFIARMASQLVSDWMRPIIRRSKSFTDKVVDDDVDDEEDDPLNGYAGGGGTRVENESLSRRHARVPEMLTQSFKRAPESMPEARSEGMGRMGVSHGAQQSERMKVYKKKLIAGQQASRRV